MNRTFKCAFQILWSVMIPVVISSCGRLAPTPIGLVAGLPLPLSKLNEKELTEDIPVFIVSSRNVKEKSTKVDPFGNKRTRHQVPNLAIGYVGIGDGMTSEEILEQSTTARRRKKARVRLKRVDVLPTIEDHDPWRLSDSYKHHSDNLWINTLRAQLDKGTSRKVVIFVHGFNTQLTTNTEQAAEIFHYLGRDGAVVNFEWPSQGQLVGYIQDKGNAEQSTRLFREMLSSLAKEVDANSITIIGHSAGNPIVVNALKELRLLEKEATPAQLQAKYKIDRVVMAAPDMDVMAFFNAVFDRFHEMANGVVVYASPNDKALQFSSLLFADDRLGRSIGKMEEWEQEVLNGLKEIEMIDVSLPERLYRSPFGHEYFYRNPWVSTDIGVFMAGRSQEQRGLVLSDTDDTFWTFPKDYVARQEARAAEIRASH